MSNNLVSIIVPIYNSSNTLKKCIDSIINQTYKNIEILLINDGSLDESLSICEQYSNIDDRVKIIDKKNGGVSSSRNIGLYVCKGDFITFVDADDYLSNTYIEKYMKKMYEYDCDIVIGNAIDFSEDFIKPNYKNERESILEKNEALIELFSEKKFSSTCWGKLYKRSLIKDVKFDENMKIAEDLKFLYNVFNKADKILISNMQEYYYYVNVNSATNIAFNKAYYIKFNFISSLIKKYKNTKLEILLIKMYVDSNIQCLMKFKLIFSDERKLITNIRQYLVKILFSLKIPIKLKLKYIYVMLKFGKKEDV